MNDIYRPCQSIKRSLWQSWRSKCESFHSLLHNWAAIHTYLVTRCIITILAVHANSSPINLCGTENYVFVGLSVHEVPENLNKPSQDKEGEGWRLWHMSKTPTADLDKGLDKELFWAGSNTLSSSSFQPPDPWVCASTQEEPNWADVAVSGIGAGHECQHRVK